MTAGEGRARPFRAKDDEDDLWRGDDRHRALAGALDKYGFWDHLPTEARKAAVSEVATGCYPFDYDWLNGHVQFFADGESLAEGGVEAFLEELAPALERFGVPLMVESLERSSARDGDYVISINGIRCVVWRSSEWPDEDTWSLATIRPLAVLNQLICAEAASGVRAHTLYVGGNEGIVLLMDPRAVEAIRESGLFPEKEIPVLAAVIC